MLEDLDYRELAARLQVSPAVARKRVSRGAHPAETHPTRRSRPMALLPEVEHALLDAIARDHAARRRTRPRVRASSLRLPAVALLALLGATTIALAASGVILTGSNVPTPGHLRPGYELGVPTRGGSELLALRAPDPAGGLPWGMRIVRTTRGYLCVQIARVQDGTLGELGIDGAFHDDGRFHSLAADALGAQLAFGVDCELSGRSGFAAAIAGLPKAQSAASHTSAKVSGASLREISFGLLGEHARKIAYRSEEGVKTADVLPGLGAYLVVQRATHGSQVGEASESSAPEGDPVDPDGTLTAITYSYGKRTCEVIGHGNALGACGFTEGPLKAKPLPVVHVPLRVQLEVHDHTITAAYLVFRAPYPVTSAAESYWPMRTDAEGSSPEKASTTTSRRGRPCISASSRSSPVPARAPCRSSLNTRAASTTTSPSPHWQGDGPHPARRPFTTALAPSRQAPARS